MPSNTASNTDHAPAPVTPDFPTGRSLERRLKHWFPWIDSNLLLQELLQPISYVVAPTGNDVTLQLMSTNPSNTSTLKLVRPSLQRFVEEIPAVIAAAQLRADRASEILVQTTNIPSFWATVVPLTQERNRHTLQLMEVLGQLCTFSELRFKHEFACARPNEYSPQIQPMIPTPLHGAYVMGHMCEAVTITVVLCALLNPAGAAGSPAQKATCDQLWRLALRVAENRIVAGVHFPVDTLGGIALGYWLGNYVLQAAGVAGVAVPQTATFDPVATTSIMGEAWLMDPSRQYSGFYGAVLGQNQIPAGANFDILKVVWDKAAKEWTYPNP